MQKWTETMRSRALHLVQKIIKTATANNEPSNDHKNKIRAIVKLLARIFDFGQIYKF